MKSSDGRRLFVLSRRQTGRIARLCVGLADAEKMEKMPKMAVLHLSVLPLFAYSPYE